MRKDRSDSGGQLMGFGFMSPLRGRLIHGTAALFRCLLARPFPGHRAFKNPWRVAIAHRTISTMYTAYPDHEPESGKTSFAFRSPR
jgi:hypothetical protein